MSVASSKPQACAVPAVVRTALKACLPSPARSLDVGTAERHRALRQLMGLASRGTRSHMRPTACFAILALLTVTVALPAVPVCGAAAPGVAQVAASSSCCGSGACYCGDHCACGPGPVAPDAGVAIVTPPVTSALLALPATADARVAVAPVNTAPHGPSAQEVVAPLPGHIHCAGNRAPPLS